MNIATLKNVFNKLKNGISGLKNKVSNVMICVSVAVMTTPAVAATYNVTELTNVTRAKLLSELWLQHLLSF